MFLIHLHQFGRQQFRVLAHDFVVGLNVEIESNTVFNLVESLAKENSRKHALRHFRHENICFIILVDSCNDNEFAEILEFSQTLLENALTANNINLSDV